MDVAKEFDEFNVDDEFNDAPAPLPLVHCFFKINCCLLHDFVDDYCMNMSLCHINKVARNMNKGYVAL